MLSNGAEGRGGERRLGSQSVPSRCLRGPFPAEEGQLTARQRSHGRAGWQNGRPVGSTVLQVTGSRGCETEEGLAERRGFEPPRQLMTVCTLSRGVPSTTRPPLRRASTNLRCLGIQELFRRHEANLAASTSDWVVQPLSLLMIGKRRCAHPLI